MASPQEPTTDNAATDSAATTGELPTVDEGTDAPKKATRAPRKRVAKKVAAPVEAPTTDSGSDSDAAAPSVADSSSRGEDLGADAAPKPARKTAKRAAKKPTKKAAADIASDAAAAEAPEQGDLDLEVEVKPKRKAAKKTSRAKKGAAVPLDDVDPLLDAATETEAQAGQIEDEAAAAVPSFGLLFQPADTTKKPTRRRATRPAAAPVFEDEAADTAGKAEGEDADETLDAAPADAPAGSTEQAEGTDGAAGEESEGGSRRSRRRRGGKGRRSRNKGEAGEPATESEEGAEESAEEESGADSEESGSSSSRRRRRRRRAGSAGGENDDPPGTVTRVREPRARDEVTGVKGSTRLEAKKQRRREGREAGRRRTIITEAEFLARRESVERVMVVRRREDRTQIAVLEDNVLVEHYVSRETNVSMAGNIYLGRVQNVLPSMEAAFVDIGKGRNAVLYAGEVNWDAAGLEQGAPKRIENALKSGDSVLVQVTKDPIGHKGARLTSQISLPGRFLVYVPEGSMTGISRKLPDTERSRLKSILKEVVPETAGVIVRTAAEGASEEELRADVERLTTTWDRIKAKADAAITKKASAGGAPALMHGEPDLTVRVIRDIFNEDFAKLVVSGDSAWEQVRDYVADVAPDLADRVTHWTSESDIFAEHRIDEQLAKAMDRKVWLPSGGSLVIDRTEAMTVVDVNTGKFVGSGGNLEETVTKNNIEAAEEIVRQLRLRDIGGIIVIDFIDMVLESNRDLVVRRLLECLGRDRTKHQVAEVTSLGLVQMTRKRVGSGLIEVFSETCAHCNGRGFIIHSEPVDRPSDGGGHQHAPQSAPTQGAGRSGRGRGRGGNSSATPVAEPAPAQSGPTAAQIAAAAHAAAVKASHHDEVAPADVQDAPAEVVVEIADQEAAPQLGISAPAVVSEPAAAVEEPVAAAPKRRRRGRVVAPAGPPRATEAAEGADGAEPGN